MLRASARFCLRRLEGLLAAGMGVLLLPLLLWRLLTCAEGWSDVVPLLKRWGAFLVHGLQPLHPFWWVQFQFESTLDVWRHLAWTELLAVQAVGRRRPACPRPLPEDARVLVIKFGHLGDLLHTVPLLRELKRQRPRSRVDLLVGPWSASLARRIPYVDGVLTYTPHFRMFHRGQRSGLRRATGEWRFFRSLAGGNYTVAMATNPVNLPELALAHASGAGSWVTVGEWPGLYARPDGSADVPYDSRKFEAELLLDLLPCLGLERGAARLELVVGAEADDSLTRFAALPPADGKPLVVLAPGGGWPGKLWPADRFAALADWLIHRYDLAVALVGSDSERELTTRIAESMTSPTCNLAGETTLDELAALIRRCRLFVGNDSAPMHLAGIFEVPSVCFFGPTYAAKWAPRHASCRVIQAEVPCEGCIPWHPSTTCLHDNRCMKSIGLERVQAIIESEWAGLLRTPASAS